MRHLPRSIFGLALLASLALSVATVALGGLVYLVSHEALEKQLDQRVEAETHHLLMTAEQRGVPALIAAIERREDGHRTSGMGYMLFDPTGRKIAGKFDAKLAAPGWHELLPYTDPQENSDEIAQALVTPLKGGHSLVVAADRTPIDEIDATIIQLFLIAFGTILVIGVGCAMAFGFVVRRRLDRINATAEAIIDGDLGRRVPHDMSGNEFDRLSETLNRMLDRNQALLENLQQVSSDIAHDLRTPLSRQKQALDMALAQDLDAAGCREAIRAAAESGEEILDLFSAILRISEIETYQVRSAFRPVDLAEVVGRVADAFRADAEASGHVIVTRADTPFPIVGDRHLLAQMIANLIENVLHHTPRGTSVSIELAECEDVTTLIVADDGPGVPAADRTRVLERFIRLEASRSEPGHGLGMSLIAAVARAHFARLTLADNAPGLRVAIAFEDRSGAASQV